MTDTASAPNKTRAIAGWVLSVLVALPFLPSAAFKLMKNPQAIEGMAHLGLGPGGVVALGVVELLVVLIYLIPRTSVLGAILVTGYIGGIIVAHLTMHLPPAIPVVMGLAVWLGLWLREPRLRAILPLTAGPSPARPA